MLAGGYPEALARNRWSRRQDWYLDYIEAIVQRDIQDIAQIEQLHQIPRLLRILAEHSGQLINYSQIGAALGMNHNTTQKYVGILESIFLTETLAPWFTNFSELRKLASWSENRIKFFHFRDRSQSEVDIVLEDRRGRVVGIEVKAAATVTQQDFQGLRKLEAALGPKFLGGLVLYDHDQRIPFSDKLAAVPISALWT